MRPQTELIIKLLGKLIETVTPSVATNTTKGKLPSAVQRKISSYDLVTRSADSDLQALLAIADLTWEQRVRPLAGKDENRLSDHYQVNLFDASATIGALDQMNANLRDLNAIQTQCEAMKGLALAIVGKTTLVGPMNGSQIGLDQMAKKKIDSRCDQIIQSIGKITQRHQNLIPHLESATAAY